MTENKLALTTQDIIATSGPLPSSHTSLRTPIPQRQADEVFPDGVKALVEPQDASVISVSFMG
ncbi:hypothetical protein GJ744_010044 [Endocarpon pusillum]|uniref:Uncharacterized protein n=1 Tax=Endocarpon pusillum TaxID=364733 RepID=A0A8H7E433_9EURO|nr:hypothetical protein GJ744_010044 [Endocarpon pusillum]